MYNGHSVSFFIETYSNADGSIAQSQLVNIAWFRSKENAQAFLERVLGLNPALKEAKLFVFENNISIEKPDYED